MVRKFYRFPIILYKCFEVRIIITFLKSYFNSKSENSLCFQKLHKAKNSTNIFIALEIKLTSFIDGRDLNCFRIVGNFDEYVL